MKKSSSTDLTKGPILRSAILFMLPLIGGSVFQQLYNTVDFLFVGNFLDKTAAAAVGASATIINCTIGLFTGISVGTGVIMAQSIGAGREDAAGRTLHTSVTFGMIGGALLLVLGIAFSPQILRALNTPESVMPQAVTYIRIYLLSIPMVIFYNMVSGGFRAEGDSASPFKVLVICGILNVGFDALFIIVLKLGVAGAAVATMVTQTLSAVMIGVMASRKGRRIRLSFRELGLDTILLKWVLRVGLPTGIQTIIITISNIFVQYFINGFGDTAVAAFATYYKVENLIFLFILAIGQTTTTFAAQNLGAGEYGRIRRGTIITSVSGALFSGSLALIILYFGETVFGWFMKDQEVVQTAVSLAAVSFPFYWIYPILEGMGGAVRGMGFSLSSMIAVIANFCILRLLLLPVILFCILCAAMLLGEHFVPMGSLLILLTLVLVLLYRLLFRKARAHNSQIQDMDGHEFEYYCADILSKNGFRNVTVTPGSNDYGADIVATREGEKWVIQCKRYSSALGNSPVQEVVAAKSYYCADRAAVMTNSSFTGNARSLAEANDVWLVDGEQLELMS